MAEILDSYGPNSRQPQAGRATNGGQCEPRDVRNYQPPQGPSNINDPKTPGLHGTNHGTCGTQRRG